MPLASRINTPALSSLKHQYPLAVGSTRSNTATPLHFTSSYMVSHPHCDRVWYMTRHPKPKSAPQVDGYNPGREEEQPLPPRTVLYCLRTTPVGEPVHHDLEPAKDDYKRDQVNQSTCSNCLMRQERAARGLVPQTRWYDAALEESRPLPPRTDVDYPKTTQVIEPVQMHDLGEDSDSEDSDLEDSDLEDSDPEEEWWNALFQTACKEPSPLPPRTNVSYSGITPIGGSQPVYHDLGFDVEESDESDESDEDHLDDQLLLEYLNGTMTPLNDDSD
ncbi:hypothetical protein FRC08_007944 [Ceratobasidium sp. 394]|nr:hypothetical protein FRC08_007944 [Ceratobasidium sp. 394]